MEYSWKSSGKFGESPSSSNPAEVFDMRVPKHLRHKKVVSCRNSGGVRKSRNIISSRDLPFARAL